MEEFVGYVCQSLGKMDEKIDELSKRTTKPTKATNKFIMTLGLTAVWSMVIMANDISSLRTEVKTLKSKIENDREE